MTQKKWIFPLAAITPDKGMIIPAGNPGKFRYSKKTMIKMAIAPYFVKYKVSVDRSIIIPPLVLC
jgi:hypothetical protein